MAKKLIKFDGEEYSIEETKFDPAISRLAQFLTDELAGTGVAIKLGGKTYNVDGKRVSTATDGFTSYLESIEGDDINVKVSGTTYGLSRAAVEDGYEIMHNKLAELSAIPVSQGLAFTLRDDGQSYAVSGIGTCTDTDIVIPDTYEGLPVTALSWGAFAWNNDITSVYVPEGVTDIDGENFSYCEQLKEVSLPNTITYISSRDTFTECPNLTYNEYNGAKYLGNSLNPYVVLFEVTDKTITNFTISADTKILIEGAFASCENLETLEIAKTITKMLRGTFTGCSNLTNVYYDGDIASWCGIFFDVEYVIEDGLQPFASPMECAENFYARNALGDYELMSGSANLVIPEGVETLEKGVFLDWPTTASVVLPSSLKTVKSYAFHNRKKRFNPANLQYNGTIADWCNISFGNSTTNPVYYTKSLYVKNTSNEYELLTNLVIPDSVTEIKDYVFSYCTSLTSVTIPDSVTNIDSYAFYYCTSLINIVMGNGVKNIGPSAFDNTGYYNNESNWENGLLYIGNYLIRANEDVEDNIEEGIYDGIRAETKIIASGAFMNCNKVWNMLIPDAVEVIGASAFKNCTSLWDVIGGNSVESIGNSAFYNCRNLQSITIPDSVTNIGEYVFRGCSALTSVTIPDSVTSIDDGMFRDCTSLKSVTIPDSVTSIGNSAFAYCVSLTSVTIPNSVASIGEYAFGGCESLTSATIGNGITNIGEEAFGCYDNLTNIYIDKPENSVSGEPWGAYNASIHWNSTGPDEI